MKRLCLLVCAALFMFHAWGKKAPVEPQDQAQARQEYLQAKVDEINQKLAGKRLSKKGSAQQVRIQLNEIQFMSHGSPFDDFIAISASQWVANDERRLADGNKLTYLIDESDGVTNSGLSSYQTSHVLRQGFNDYNREFGRIRVAVRLEERADSGDDPDFYDSFFGYGGSGDPFLADIVQAGWLPGDFFEAAGGPGGREGILAFAVSFIFIDDDDNPTDIDNDGYIDRALTEVYYNDYFGDPGGTRAGSPWGIDELPLPGINVRTVGTHENGHSLGIGHIPDEFRSLQNAIYAGPEIRVDPAMKYNLKLIYQNWPWH